MNLKFVNLESPDPCLFLFINCLGEIDSETVFLRFKVKDEKYA
jgi:hypothetical protein